MRKTVLEESLGRAGPRIRSLLAKLQTPGTTQAIERELTEHLRTLQEKMSEAQYLGMQKDHLYRSTYLHTHYNVDGPCDRCDQKVRVRTKEYSEIGCDEGQLMPRAGLAAGNGGKGGRLPQSHFGRYGSANSVLKSGIHRDEHIHDDKMIAFEMEAAGVWESISTLVIKSACDYADSHKNQRWQSYAAASAASGLKAILERLEVSDHTVTQAEYDVPFSLEGVPIAKKFIDRPHEMQKMEEVLLQPNDKLNRRKLFVLRGLGGIGKTQLAVEFMRKHQDKFSAIFWLDGSTADSFKQSIARQAGRIPADQISKQSREYATTPSGYGGYDFSEALFKLVGEFQLR